MDGTSQSSTTTDSLGRYAFIGLKAGSYSLTPSMASCTLDPGVVNLNGLKSGTTTQNFNASGSSCGFRTGQVIPLNQPMRLHAQFPSCAENSTITMSSITPFNVPASIPVRGPIVGDETLTLTFTEDFQQPTVTKRGPSSASPDSVAAVLSPKGRLLHATGDATLADARRALEAAVVNIERARTVLRGDDERALAAWRGLVSARWTLVDQIDAPGARYIVARENPPSATGLPTLTLAERSVVAYAARGFSTKEIAYSLGLADTTVRVLIMRAVRRSGLRSRDELLARTRAAAVEND
jgi:DNA-binding CsgD family transcriptional regulator